MLQNLHCQRQQKAKIKAASASFFFKVVTVCQLIRRPKLYMQCGGFHQARAHQRSLIAEVKTLRILAHLAEHAIGLRYGDHGPFQGHLYPFTPLHFCDSLPCRKPCHDHHEDPLCHEHRYIWDPSCTTQTANASKAPPAKETLQLGFLLKFLNL